MQNGGSPTTFDRILATRFAISAIDFGHEGDVGKIVALRTGQIIRVPLTDATGETRRIDQVLYETVSVFFG